MSFRGGGGYGKQLLPFGLEYSDLNSLGIEKGKNKLPLPINGPVTQLEKDTVQQYLNIQRIMSEGPFYTGSLQALKQGKGKKLLYDEGDGINDGIKRYSDKYRKKRKIGRSIDEHPYILEFFPTELYNVMGVDKNNSKKLLSLSNFQKKSILDDASVFLQRADELKLNELLETLTEVASNLKTADDDHVPDDFDEDDEFDEEDDDDYNAEKYFDGGDDSDRGDDDDGDDEAAF